MGKLKIFKCHICKNRVLITSGNKIRCENCGSEYILKDGKFYKENCYSKMYKNF